MVSVSSMPPFFYNNGERSTPVATTSINDTCCGADDAAASLVGKELGAHSRGEAIGPQVDDSWLPSYPPSLSGAVL